MNNINLQTASLLDLYLFCIFVYNLKKILSL